MSDRITNWKTFVESGRSFFDANQGCLMFRLIETLDELYRVARAKAPFPKIGIENFFHMCFLICHRALLSAATSTGSGLPEDGATITRRALEAAKVCLAVKTDPDNFAVWKAIKVRKGRWEARGKGDGPRGPVNPQYKGVLAEPLYMDLRAVIGVLSDFTVHFTPEHLGSYEWEEIPNTDGTVDMKFGVKEDAVAKELLMIADQHRLILRVFDRCLDGQLLEQAEVKQVAQRALGQYKDLLQREGFHEQAIAVGQSW